MKSQKIYAQVILLNVLFATWTFCQIDPAIDARLEKRSHTFQNLTIPYRLYVPDNYAAKNSYPLLLFLHGARWAGTDNVTQLDNELALYWIDSTRQTIHPCFVVYPQIPAGKSWEYASGQINDLPASPELATANDIITSLLNEFTIDRRRLYVCGKSIGALGVYGMLARYPNRYSAAIPAAGYYLYCSLTDLSNHSLWLFHNKDDNVVSAGQSRHVVTELENIGGSFLLTHCNFKTSACDTLSRETIDSAIAGGATQIYSEFDDAGHQLEPNVVSTYGLYDWVMAQSKTESRIEDKDRYMNFRLCNYPNPFNNGTTITFTLDRDMPVRLRVWSVKGELVSTLMEGWLESGHHQYFWRAIHVTSGIYLVELSSQANVQLDRCTLLK